jgi:NAD(P)-dependent dehydrogenase (short-subunit alcohol dehydrogenase family)
LDEHRVLVTGGGSGLGRAIVTRFVEEGAHVGVLEIDAGKAADLQQQFGDAVAVTVGDATTWDGNRHAVADTVGAFGGLDVFVGNAGVWDFGRPLDTLRPEQIDGAFDEVFHLNVKAYLLGAKAAVGELRATSGSIVYTVSNAGFWPGGGGPLYVASKHAVVGLVKQLAYELAPDVRVNGVAAGAMPTDLRGPRALGLDTTSFGQLPVDKIATVFTALERPIEPVDYTGHYVLLASRRESRTVTGTVHICDGGVGVRGRKEVDAALARALAEDER